MKILWLTWKDRKHPAAGGAEIVNEELAKRLVQDGHEVVFLVGGYDGCLKEEMIGGCKIVRLGNRFSVYWQAYRYYKKNLQGWADLVVDEVNTIPFFAKYYTNEKCLLFVHQLCREIWFYQMMFPFSLIGYLLEPIYLWLLNDQEVVTVSESTKKDLMRYGFKPEKIHIISEGVEILPLPEGDKREVKKFITPTILSLGAIRAMKRTDHIVKAFAIAKEKITDLKLILAGDYKDEFGAKVLRLVNESKYKNDIDVKGRVTIEEKIALMQKAHVLAVTSVKEGWGLVVTEAASQGAVSVVYDVDGLRDAVRDGETGLICKQNTPECLAENIAALLSDQERYGNMRQNGWEWSKKINFENGYKSFIEILKNL